MTTFGPGLVDLVSKKPFDYKGFLIDFFRSK